MSMLLKDLLKESEETSPLKVQLYLDLDGVMADLDKGFKRLSGGLGATEYQKIHGKGSFWEVIGRKDPTTRKPKHPNFWIDLEPMPDAQILWKFIKENFKNPDTAILSAGQGETIKQQKTEWVRRHIDPNVKVIIADAGARKSNFILPYPSGQRITHLLLDDHQKNINAWNNEAKHQIGILHTNAASSIKQLNNFLPEIK